MDTHREYKSTTETTAKKSRTGGKSTAKATKAPTNQTQQEERDSREANRQGIEAGRQEAKPDRSRDPDPRKVQGPDELQNDVRSDAGAAIALA